MVYIIDSGVLKEREAASDLSSPIQKRVPTFIPISKAIIGATSKFAQIMSEVEIARNPESIQKNLKGEDLCSLIISIFESFGPFAVEMIAPRRELPT